jgi:hypothetical protein
MSEGCFCATTRDGQAAGCACVSVVETEHGPRFSEGPLEAKGDGSYLAATLARAARADAAEAEAGPPPGAYTGRTVMVKAEDGSLRRGRVVWTGEPVSDGSTLTREAVGVFLENGSLVRRRVAVVPE